MWTVITTDLFNEWLEQQDESTQEKVLAALDILQQQGPSLCRRLEDTLLRTHGDPRERARHLIQRLLAKLVQHMLSQPASPNTWSLLRKLAPIISVLTPCAL